MTTTTYTSDKIPRKRYAPNSPKVRNRKKMLSQSGRSKRLIDPTIKFMLMTEIDNEVGWGEIRVRLPKGSRYNLDYGEIWQKVQ